MLFEENPVITKERFLELVRLSCEQIPAQNIRNMVAANRRHIRLYLDKIIKFEAEAAAAGVVHQ